MPGQQLPENETWRHAVVGAAVDKLGNVDGVDMNEAREGISDFFQDLLAHKFAAL